MLMSRQNVRRLGFPVAIALLSCAGLLGACGGDSTAPEKDLCSLVSMSRRADLAVNLSCSSVEFNVSQITYDQFSRRTSFSYSARCTDGSANYSGQVSNIVWNNLGETLSADVTINGRSCHINF
jgi:hypothetical protein